MTGNTVLVLHEIVIQFWVHHGIEEVYREQWSELEDFSEAFPPGLTAQKKKYLFKNVASRWKRLISQPDQK